MAAKRAGNYQADAVGDLDPRRIAPAHVNMRRAISAKGLTQIQFAGVLGIGKSTLDRWLKGDPENAERCRLPNEALVRAAHVLGVSVWYLLDLTDSPDGSGARPLEQHRLIKDFWGKAKDPEKAAPVVDYWLFRCLSTGEEKRVTIGETLPPCNYEHGWELASWEEKGFVPLQVALGQLPWEGHDHLKREVAPDGQAVRYWALDWTQSDTPSFVHIDVDCEEVERERARLLDGHPLTRCTATPGGPPNYRAASKGADAFLQFYRVGKTEMLEGEMEELPGDYRDPLAVVKEELAYASGTAGSEEFDALLARVDADARGVMGTDSLV